MKRLACLLALVCVLCGVHLCFPQSGVPQSQGLEQPPQSGGGLSGLQAAAQEQPQVIPGKLTSADPPDPVHKKSPHKVHLIPFKAGQHYQIDLASKDFDAFLRLEDPTGKPLAQDNDSGGGQNARLLFSPPKTGTYRLVTTAFPEGQTTGVYTLTIRLIDAATLKQALLQRAASLNNQVGALWQQGRAQEALPLAQETLAICQKLLGEHNPRYAIRLNNLASLYQAMGRYEQALPLFQQALKIRKQLVGEHHPDYALSLNNLAALYRAMGRYEQALPLLQQAHKIRKQRLGEHHPDYAQSLNNLAMLYYDMGRYEQALPLFQQALQIRKQRLGEHHPDYANSLNNLAGLYRAMGRYKQALSLFQQALQIRKTLGDHHPLYAQSLNNLADLYQAMGRFEQALPFYQQALQIHQQLGAHHPSYALSLNNLAMLYQDMSRYEQALPLLQQALQIRQKLGDHHPDYALSLNNLALLYQAMGRYEQALPLFQQALQIRKQRLGDHHPDYALSLNNLALLYQAMGRYEQVLPLLQQARKIRKTLGDHHPDYALSLHNLAGLYRDMGHYEQALPLCQQALQIRKQRLGDHHPDYALSLNNLASLYQDMGRYEQALPLFQQALQIHQQLGKHHPHYAASLNNLAELYRVMGRYENALPLLQQALVIFQELGEHHPRYAASLNYLALLYQAMGRYEQALPLYQQALKIRKQRLGEHHPDYATSVNNLARLYQAMGRYEQALPLYQQALRICKKLGEHHPSYAGSLHNLASLYQAMSRYKQALPLYQQALTIHQQLGAHHPLYALSLNNLAGLYYAMGRYEQALPLYQQALKIRKQLGAHHPDYATSLDNLAGLYYAMGQPSKAVDWSHQGLMVQYKHLDNTFSALTHQDRLRLLGQKRNTLHGYLSAAQQAELAVPQLYRQVLLSKGAVHARQSEELVALDQPQLAPLLDALRLKRASLAKLSQLTPPTPEEQTAWQQRFQKTEKELEDLEVDLALQSEPFRRFRELRQATAQDVCDALPAKTALIDFLFYTHWTPNPDHKGQWLTEERLLAFVLAPGHEPVLVPLGKAATPKQLVQDWRKAVEAEKGVADLDALGHKLRAKLWLPLGKHLRGLDTVLIAPDEELCQLPFAALPGSKKGTYLLEEYAIGYVLSGRQLLELQADSKRPKSQGLLAIGGLKYGRPNQLQAAAFGAPDAFWPDLAGSLVEAEQVQQQFQERFAKTPAQLFTGEQPDGPAFAQLFTPGKMPQRFQYLHLATHGHFEPPVPLRDFKDVAGLGPMQLHRETVVYQSQPLFRSQLVLAGANVAPGQGILTAQEIASLDMRGLDLAVLSACDTGLGTLKGGEGVQGLQQAFHQAGSRTLVASLWSIHDGATALLMDEFYRNLWQKKMTKVEALRQAQLTLLRHPELIKTMQKTLGQKLKKRGLWTEEDRLAFASVAAVGLPAPWWGQPSPVTAALVVAAPAPGHAWRSIGRKAPPLPEGGGQADRRTHPAYWAAFVLSGDTH